MTATNCDIYMFPAKKNAPIRKEAGRIGARLSGNEIVNRLCYN